MRTPAAVSLRRACVPHFRLGEMHLPQQSDGEEPRSRRRLALRGDVIGRTLYARCDGEAGGNSPARRTPPPRRSVHLADNLRRKTRSQPARQERASRSPSSIYASCQATPRRACGNAGMSCGGSPSCQAQHGHTRINPQVVLACSWW